MREYGVVHSQFWIDTYIEKLSLPAKFLAVYLLAGPQTSMIGCFRAPLGYIAEDLKLDISAVKQLLNELIAIDFVYYDETTGWLLIYDFLKWNPIMNPNQGKLAKKLVEMIPKESSVLPKLADCLLRYGKHIDEKVKKQFETISKRFQNQEQDQEQKQDQYQEQEPNTHVEQKSSMVLVKTAVSNLIDKITNPTNSLIRKVAEISKTNADGNTLTAHEHQQAIDDIFSHWQITCKHPKAVLNETRYAVISDALNMGYSVNQLITAITGCSLTPFNQGRNERAKPYDGLELILRDADQIDRFIHNAECPPTASVPLKIVKA